MTREEWLDMAKVADSASKDSAVAMDTRVAMGCIQLIAHHLAEQPDHAQRAEAAEVERDAAINALGQAQEECASALAEVEKERFPAQAELRQLVTVTITREEPECDLDDAIRGTRALVARTRREAFAEAVKACEAVAEASANAEAGAHDCRRRIRKLGCAQGYTGGGGHL